MAKKLKQGAEGLIVVAIGLFLLINSMNIASNPIRYKGWTNVLAQAKFIPIVMSAGIIILGAVLFAKQTYGKSKTAELTKSEWFRMGVVLLMTVAYCFAVTKVKFMFPTIVYALGMIFFLNWGKKKIWVLTVISLAAIALGLYVMPLLINLRLPMY